MNLLTLLLSLAIVGAAVTEEQLNCLYRIYDETGGDSWHVKTNWPPKALRVFPHDPCKFFGITCTRNQEIETIVLSGNNLVGSLPGCLHVFEVTDMEFSTNKLTSEFPRVNCSKLDTLYYKFNKITSLPSNICECTSLQYLHIEYNNMQGHVLPKCLLERSQQFGILYAVNTNLSLDDASSVRSLAASNMILGGNSLNLDFSTANLETAPDTTMLDISGTQSTGEVKLQELFALYPAARELNLQQNKFTGNPFTKFKPSASLQVLDLDNNSFSAILDSDGLGAYFQQFPSNLIVFRTSNNRITGFPPSDDVLRKINLILPNLQVLDLGNNPFLCPEDMTGISTECTHIVVEKINVVKDAIVQVTMFLSSDAKFKSIDVDLISSRLSISIKNLTAGQDADVWRTYQLSDIGDISVHNAETNKYKAMLELSEADAVSLLGPGFQTVDTKNVRVLFDGQRVSAPTPKADDTKEEHRKYVASPTKLSRDASSRKILVEFYGISRCPGYISTVNDLIAPFIQEYPELLQIADFAFVSQADAEQRYAARGITMHGQGEVLGDRFLMCLQEYVDYFIFNDVTTCLYSRGSSSTIPYDIEKCLAQVIPDQRLRRSIYDCKDGDMATSLFVESKKKCRDLGAAFSCTIFADSQLVCPFSDDSCPFNPYSVKDFATYLCNLYRAKNLYVHDMCKIFFK